MIQINGIKRHIFMKFVNDTYLQNILQSTNGSVEYRHTIREISIVRLAVAGMGMRRIRLVNLPTEVTEINIRTALSSYGEIVSIKDEMWSNAYGYKVANGVKVIRMKMAKHLPSQMNIAGHRALPSYDCQPATLSRVWGQWTYKSGMPYKASRRYGNIRFDPQYMGP